MNPLGLVRPLEDAWQDVLDTVLRERGAPTTSEVARLAPKVIELSRAYNAGLAGDARGPGAGPRLPLEARIGFSFARDVPKGAAAVRELVATGALTFPEDRPLRIVDLGAGLGAMTWGVARALEAAGGAGRIEAVLIDEDAAALTAARAIATKAATKFAEKPVSLTVETRAARIAPGMSVPAADVVILGQVLSELDLTLEPEARAERHAAILAELLRTALLPNGSLVVIEPALRDRTRHLHAIRDRLVALGDVSLFAPCLHARPCPALAVEGEWCHDDLPVDLPRWVVPLARASSLRWQGLTYSYLVLKRSPDAGDPEASSATLGGRLPAPSPSRVHLRVISDLLRSKGKIELFGCTSEGERVRMRRLDRDVTEASAAWDDLHRGDIVTLHGREASLDAPAEPPVDPKGRTSPHLRVDVWPFRK